MRFFRRGRTAAELRQEERRLGQIVYERQQRVAGREGLRSETLKQAVLDGDDVAAVREAFDAETKQLVDELHDLEAELAATAAVRDTAGAAEAPGRMRELWEQLPFLLDARDAAAAALGQGEAAIAAALTEMGSLDIIAARARYGRKWPEDWPVPNDSTLNRLRAIGHTPTFQRAPAPDPQPVLTIKAGEELEVHDRAQAGGADMVRRVIDRGLAEPAADNVDVEREPPQDREPAPEQPPMRIVRPQ